MSLTRLQDIRLTDKKVFVFLYNIGQLEIKTWKTKTYNSIKNDLWINIAKDVQDLCYENYNTSLTLNKIEISGQRHHIRLENC